MASESITSGEFAITLGTDVRLLAGVQFTVALQVMKAAEAHLAFCANVGFLLAMRQQMALKIVMTRELSIAVGTFMLFGSG